MEYSVLRTLRSGQNTPRTVDGRIDSYVLCLLRSTDAGLGFNPPDSCQKEPPSAAINLHRKPPYAQVQGFQQADELDCLLPFAKSSRTLIMIVEAGDRRMQDTSKDGPGLLPHNVLRVGLGSVRGRSWLV